MSFEDERNLAIGGIYFQLLNINEAFAAGDSSAESKFDSLVRELEALGLSEHEIDAMVAASEKNPQVRKIHKQLYVDNPSLPNESRRSHFIRVFGDEGEEIADEMRLP